MVLLKRTSGLGGRKMFSKETALENECCFSFAIRALPSIISHCEYGFGFENHLLRKKSSSTFRLFVFVARGNEKDWKVFSILVEYSATKYNHDLH